MSKSLSQPDIAVVVGAATVAPPTEPPANEGPNASQFVGPLHRANPDAVRSLFLHQENSPYWDPSPEKLLRNLSTGAPSYLPHVRTSEKAIYAAMCTHSRPVLQFSGGKDSLACLYLLRPYWDRLTVMWSSRGDAFPEARELFEDVRRMVHAVIEVGGDEQWRAVADKTWAADCVPDRATWFGRTMEPTNDGFALVHRYDCCLANFWKPMAQATEAGGFDLIIRGQRDDEAKRAPFSSGAIDGAGRTYLLPIQHWTKQDVFAYLEAEGVEVPRQYGYGLSSLDCLHCTAYLEENGAKLRYLRDFHPEAAVEYERRLRLIQSEQERQSRLMKIALGELDPSDGEGSGD